MNRLLELRRQFAAAGLTKADFIGQMHAIHATLNDYPALLQHGDVRSVEITGEGVIFVSRDGLRFRCDPADTRAAPVEALNFGGYESGDGKLFWQLVGPGQVIFDVGAHIGWYALHVAARFPSARVFAFEPVNRSAELLRANVATNRMTNITVFDIGLSDCASKATMFVPDGVPTAASAADLTGRGKVEAVDFRRLDDVVCELEVAPAVIKIDVEGAELAVLRGAVETLKAHRPAVFCEMLRKWSAAHGSHPNEALAFMTDLGYSCWFADDTGLRELTAMTDDVAATNFVFRPRERPA